MIDTVFCSEWWHLSYAWHLTAFIYVRKFMYTLNFHSRKIHPYPENHLSPKEVPNEPTSSVTASVCLNIVESQLGFHL